MQRGDIQVFAARGEFTGKPRPFLIVQSDAYPATASITVCAISTTRADPSALRIPVHPSPQTGLKETSWIMVDKVVTVPRSKAGQRLGSAPSDLMERVDAGLVAFLGLT